MGERLTTIGWDKNKRTEEKLKVEDRLDMMALGMQVFSIAVERASIHASISSFDSTLHFSISETKKTTAVTCC